MARRVAFILFFACIPPAGCHQANPPSYLASSDNNPVGYAESPVRPDCYEIAYVGYKNFTPQNCIYYASLRAAELAVKAGKPYVEILLMRSSTGRQTIVYPPTYDTEYVTDANGTMDPATVETSPGYTETDNLPMTTILVRLLDAPNPNSWDAVGTVAEAQKNGTIAAPRTPAGKSTTRPR